ncbi:MAG TPA: rhamnose/proton symporter RhaT [Planctomycetaceae bacterium]|nr:rhamnose/proton symporter RhaT [Planctomycetaceae bacterium]HIQ20823.1 rhamnose/proton symporter RhaT [Planctomycetota bacterium]
MTPSAFLGVFLHAVGGFAAGSFYAPLKQVQRWAWESFWLVMGLAAWLAAPWIVARITTPDLFEVLATSPAGAMGLAVLFGALWGLGNLTFGLSVRYLGMALGYAVALGFCMVFGTLVPPVFHGLFGSAEDWEKLVGLFTLAPGQTTLVGVAVCLAGIGLCGLAGMCKERELAEDQKRLAVDEFALGRGFAVATMAGILSACFAFGLAAGGPIAEVAVRHGTERLFSNNAVLVVILVGGFLSNATWCLILNARNRSFKDYVTGPASQQLRNYLLSALGGVIWYAQFFFYGMGTTKLGEQYGFSSWSIHMAFIIVFSNLWGIVFHEWRGTSGKTRGLVWTGILTLIASTMIIGYGNYLASQGS